MRRLPSEPAAHRLAAGGEEQGRGMTKAPWLMLAGAVAGFLGVVAALPGYEGYLIRPDGSEAATPGLALVSAGA